MISDCCHQCPRCCPIQQVYKCSNPIGIESGVYIYIYEHIVQQRLTKEAPTVRGTKKTSRAAALCPLIITGSNSRGEEDRRSPSRRHTMVPRIDDWHDPVPANSITYQLHRTPPSPLHAYNPLRDLCSDVTPHTHTRHTHTPLSFFDEGCGFIFEPGMTHPYSSKSCTVATSSSVPVMNGQHIHTYTLIQMCNHTPSNAIMTESSFICGNHKMPTSSS